MAPLARERRPQMAANSGRCRRDRLRESAVKGGATHPFVGCAEASRSRDDLGGRSRRAGGAQARERRPPVGLREASANSAAACLRKGRHCTSVRRSVLASALVSRSRAMPTGGRRSPSRPRTPGLRGEPPPNSGSFPAARLRRAVPTGELGWLCVGSQPSDSWGVALRCGFRRSRAMPVGDRRCPVRPRHRGGVLLSAQKTMAANSVRCRRDRGESVKGGHPPFTNQQRPIGTRRRAPKARKGVSIAGAKRRAVPTATRCPAGPPVCAACARWRGGSPRSGRQRQRVPGVPPDSRRSPGS